MLAAAEEQLGKIAAAAQRARRPLRGREAIALRVGGIIERFRMAKHFELAITETSLTCHRREEAIASEAALDGLHVIRTSLDGAAMDASAAASVYKSLAHVERAFRSIKTMAMHVRPVFHYNSERVRAHVFLCMLALRPAAHARASQADIVR
ncbi:MAG: transposase [Desulfobulbus sp.]|nr:transposase [Desulfobulbus sp.]